MQWTPWRVFLTVCGVLSIIIPIVLIGNIVETLGAGEIMVIQSPVSGKLTIHTEPGLKGQWFGTVTKYKKRDQFWFSASPDQGKSTDQSLRIRFNDGAGANISGSIAWEMPVDVEHVTLLHSQYGSHIGIEQQLIRTVMEKAVYMTGPFMSSTESFAERRNELLGLIEEQTIKGIFATETHTTTVTDELTKQIRTKNVVRLKKDKDGKQVFADESPLEKYGLRVSNLSINQVKYEKIVEDQIAEQQKQLGAIQVAIAEARKAEQAAITAEQSGRANAATAKWKQEEVNAKEIAEAEKTKQVAELKAAQEKNVAVTKGEQLKQVADLEKQAAEFTKQQQILLGEGESERRRLVLAADGALEAKLRAYVEVNAHYATALKEYKGSWMPQIVFGGNNDGQTGVSSVQDLMNMLTVKTAKELALDMSLTKGSK